MVTITVQGNTIQCALVLQGHSKVVALNLFYATEVLYMVTINCAWELQFNMLVCSFFSRTAAYLIYIWVGKCSNLLWAIKEQPIGKWFQSHVRTQYYKLKYKGHV